MGQIRSGPHHWLAHAGGEEHLPPLAMNRILTTEANSIVAPIHPKAMPVILTTPEEFDLRASKPTFRSFALAKAVDGGSLTLGLTLILRESARSVP
jgi:putative SOS response-associated peptidase YedK